jgi:hypothetical protein
MVETARDALGDRADVRLEAAASPPAPEGEPSGAERPTPVRAGPTPPDAGVVELTWEGPNGARLRCYLPTANRWIARSVTFDEDDPEVERGRTLGFLVASIFVEAPMRSERPEPIAPPPEKDSAPLPAPKPASEPAPPPAARAGAAAALAAVGPGDGMSFGAHVAFDYRVTPSLRVGIAGEARFGTLPSVQATLRFLAGGASVTWEAFQPSPGTFIGPSLGLYGAELRVTHLASSDPTPATRSRPIFVLHPMLSGGLGIGGSSAVFAELGVEVHAGRTTVVVEPEKRARIGFATPTARLGLRTDF